MTNSDFLRAASVDEWLRRFVVVAVIPAFNVEREIESVLTSLPDFLRHVVVVDDASNDQTSAVVMRVAACDSRVTLL